jgi:hypothetical protein
MAKVPGIPLAIFPLELAILLKKLAALPSTLAVLTPSDHHPTSGDRVAPRLRLTCVVVEGILWLAVVHRTGRITTHVAGTDPCRAGGTPGNRPGPLLLQRPVARRPTGRIASARVPVLSATRASTFILLSGVEAGQEGELLPRRGAARGHNRQQAEQTRTAEAKPVRLLWRASRGHAAPSRAVGRGPGADWRVAPGGVPRPRDHSPRTPRFARRPRTAREGRCGCPFRSALFPSRAALLAPVEFVCRDASLKRC